MKHTRPDNKGNKLKLKGDFLELLDNVYFACLDAWYTLKEDKDTIKNLMIVNTLSIWFNIDRCIELYLEGVYEAF